MNSPHLGAQASLAPTTRTEQDAVWTRINRRVVPIVLIAYIMAFLDRINVGYAKLTMQSDLQFSDQVYGLGAGIFFITYLLFEVPSNLWMERVGARLTFLRIMVLWGITSAASAFVTTPTQFYVARLLLGMFEAGFFPGVILYLTYWYPSARRGRVTGLFLFGMPITGVIGGPLSGYILKHFDGVLGWHGWQWVFVLEGLPAVIMGVIVYLLLADRPEQARWLSAREKAVVREAMAADHFAGDGTRHQRNRLLAALADPQTYVLSFVYFTCACAVYTLTFWLPTMIRGLGITDMAQVGLYSAIPFGCGGAGILALSYSSDRLRERRWHVASTLVVGSLVLYATQFLDGAFVPTMIALSIASFFIFGCALFWAIPPTCLSPDASAAGIAVISAIGILGGFVSPALIGWLKAVTGSFSAGLLPMTALICCGGLVVLTLVKRDAVRVGEPDLEPKT
ncbi:MFS transporter [Chitinasiproducens palmae]|uniref:D-galactonate transporter n=1 Tax=Chitinasiproducens palmae TaxID=1770053 RepID=A0A1H2PU35_9BURK|nr:MFS transporter [Chitinasiproducens palmae]SDV50682.1 D-galactonate transporter [Chitinasiproducens palmae]